MKQQKGIHIEHFLTKKDGGDATAEDVKELVYAVVTLFEEKGYIAGGGAHIEEAHTEGCPYE